MADEQTQGRRPDHHQEVRQPAALQHAIVELHHARGPVADDPRRDRFPGARRQDRRRHHPPDPDPDHHGGGNARRADAADQLPAPADLDVRQFDAVADAALPRSDDGQFPRQPAQAAGNLEDEHGRRTRFAKLAETNMAMFKAAASAFMPGAKPAEPPPRQARRRAATSSPRCASRWPRCSRSSTSCASSFPDARVAALGRARHFEPQVIRCPPSAMP